MYSMTYCLLFCYTSLLIQEVLNIRISSTAPSASRRKSLVTSRSREPQFCSGDENSQITIGSNSWTYRSNEPQQTNRDGNFPNLILSVSNHRIRPNNVLRDMNNNESVIRELIRTQTVNARKASVL